jgi:YVTN family beta-propeller protein
MAFLTLLWMACGQVYRPVVIPCSQGAVPGCPVEPPPIPANFHAVYAISTNVPNNPGWATEIDVSGDTLLAETPINGPDAPNGGLTPTHAALLPNNSKLFVANAGSVQGGLDAVSSFSPAVQSTTSTGFGPLSAVSLPTPTSSITAISESGNLVTATLSAPLNNVPVGYTIVISNVVIPGCVAPACNQNAYNGAFPLLSNLGTTITYSNPNLGLAAASGGTAAFPPQPVFLNSTQNSAMYVANYNTNSVSAINTVLNVVSNSVAVGVHPVSLAETPNGLKLYVANQGSNSVSTLNTASLSPNTANGLVAGFTGITPVWVVARGDSQKVYVLTQGDGQLVTIDTATDTVTGSLSVGAGANFIFFDPYLNRLYVTNPATSMVYVFSDTGGANDTPIQLGAISFASGSVPCPAGCSPTSVTALPDGSRFYVASYQITSSASPCPDPTVNVSPCLIPGLTVFAGSNLTVQYPSAPTLTLLTWSPPCSGTTCPTGPFATNQYALPPVAGCASPVPPAVYAPGTTRFRVFTTASMDSTRVYVSMCDGGAIADINTTDSNTNNGSSGAPADTLVTDLPAPYAGPSQTLGSPLQTPIFMLSGQ